MEREKRNKTRKKIKGLKKFTRCLEEPQEASSYPILSFPLPLSLFFDLLLSFEFFLSPPFFCLPGKSGLGSCRQ